MASSTLATRTPRHVGAATLARDETREGAAMATEQTRLTRSDIAAMVDRVSAVLADGGRDAGRAWLGGPMTAETLERIACHAIGCTAADLRDVELVTVAQVVDAATEHAKTMLAARVWPAHMARLVGVTR